MQNNIVINVVSYDKTEIKRYYVVNLIARIHSKEIDLKKTNKRQLMRSKKYGRNNENARGKFRPIM